MEVILISNFVMNLCYIIKTTYLKKGLDVFRCQDLDLGLFIHKTQLILKEG